MHSENIRLSLSKKKENQSKNVEDLKKIPTKHSISKNTLYNFKYTWASDGMKLFLDKSKLSFSEHEKEIIREIIIDQFPEKHRSRVNIINNI